MVDTSAWQMPLRPDNVRTGARRPAQLTVAAAAAAAAAASAPTPREAHRKCRTRDPGVGAEDKGWLQRRKGQAMYLGPKISLWYLLKYSLLSFVHSRVIWVIALNYIFMVPPQTNSVEAHSLYRLHYPECM